MDSTLAPTDAQLEALSPTVRLVQRLMMLVAATLFVSVLLAAGVILIRRLIGGIVAPLSPAGLVLCGVLLVAMVAVLRFAGGPFVRRLSAPRRRMVSALAPACLLLLTASVLSLPESSVLGLIGLWGTAVAGAAFVQGVASARRAMPPALRPASNLAPINKPNIWQRLTRLREADGTEVVEAWVRTDIPAGARTAHVHLAFCPPFSRTPVLEAEQDDGPAATLKVGPVYPHGARVDIRLDQPLPRPASVDVGVVAREKER